MWIMHNCTGKEKSQSSSAWYVFKYIAIPISSLFKIAIKYTYIVNISTFFFYQTMVKLNKGCGLTVV